MSNIFSKLFFYLRYILIVVAFLLIFWGITFTYQRLEKPLSESFNVLLPFVLVFVVFIVNLFVAKRDCSENLLFNFGTVLILLVVILVGLRAKFDTNMLIYYKYNISYNSAYLADNLAMIESMLYIIFGSNVLFIIGNCFNKKEKEQDKKTSVKMIDNKKINGKKIK